jgi:hypothetical protein
VRGGVGSWLGGSDLGSFPFLREIKYLQQIIGGAKLCRQFLQFF